MDGVFVELFLIFLADVAKTVRVSGLRLPEGEGLALLILVCYNERAVFSCCAKRLCALLVVALLAAVVAVYCGADWLLRLIAISVLGVCVIELVVVFRGRHRQESEENSRDKRSRLDQAHFATLRGRLEERMAAGQLLRVEEWWEDDDLWIDENAHILFVFSDGEEMDFVLYENIAPEISRLFATQGICWQASFRLTSGSRVIWQKP